MMTRSAERGSAEIYVSGISIFSRRHQRASSPVAAPDRAILPSKERRRRSVIWSWSLSGDLGTMAVGTIGGGKASLRGTVASKCPFSLRWANDLSLFSWQLSKRIVDIHGRPVIDFAVSRRYYREIRAIVLRE